MTEEQIWKTGGLIGAQQRGEAMSYKHNPNDFDHERVRCPDCGEEHYDITDLSSLQRDGDETTMDCETCGKTMTIVLSVSYEYASRPVEP